jgi:serine/threonine protein kinase
MPFGRPPISRTPLYDRYKEENQLTITQGDFNGGIFKVRDRETSKSYIEKRFKPEHVKKGIAYDEITILRSLKHKNIVEYVDAFLQEGPRYRASIYMNPCYFGSLDVCSVFCLPLPQKLMLSP